VPGSLRCSSLRKGGGEQGRVTWLRLHVVISLVSAPRAPGHRREEHRSYPPPDGGDPGAGVPSPIAMEGDGPKKIEDGVRTAVRVIRLQFTVRHRVPPAPPSRGVGRCSETRVARATPTFCPADRPGYESKTRTVRLPGSATARVQCAVVRQKKATFWHRAMRFSSRLAREDGQSSGGPDRYP
jgi:hypothetical protein